MNFGFVKTALKAVGKGALTVGETVAPAAATAFGGPLAGTLAKIAVDGIAAAQAKHAAVPHGTLVLSPAVAEPVPVELAKKLDVMTYMESQSGAIADLVLNMAGHPVADPQRFAQGVDLMVEGLVDVMKAIKALPVATEQTPRVTQASIDVLEVPKSLRVAPEPSASTVVVPTPLAGIVSNLDTPASAPTPVSADVITLLNQVLQRLGPKVTVTA